MSNLSQLKRQRMLEFLNKIRAEHTDDDALIAINEIETALTEKKYGLVWEQHEERVDIEMQTKVPVFSEVADKEIIGDKSAPYNFLLEGDNLHSLKLLEKTHTGRINVIYIDPPYNTGGQDFTYNDEFVDKTDAFRHSKWLSFMASRLELLRTLLSDDGVIFISIGEQEVANLRLLCDDLMGEDNFITIFSRQMKSGGAKGKFYTPNIDYVLAYAKDITKLPNFKAIMTDKQIEVFYNKTETSGERAGEIYGEERLFKASLDARPNQRYYIQCPDGTFAIPPGSTFPEHLVEGETVLPTKQDKVWKWIYPRYQAELAKNNIVFKKTKTSGLVDEHGNKSNWNIYNKLWLSEQQDKGVVPSNFITEYENRQSAAEMKDLGIDFTYAKPTNLVKYLLTIANQPKDIIVLDCFAGSGTTGHAVLKMNSEDGGSRRFILCTNNESGICETITYPRIKTVISGKRTDGTGYSNNYPANLKYYRTQFVAKTSEEEDYSVGDELLKHIVEMVQLEHAVKIDGTNCVLLLSDEQADSFIGDITNLDMCKAVYISTAVLLTAVQQKELEKRGIEIYTIPDYYFESELLEVGER